jgi:hypothetical protein
MNSWTTVMNRRFDTLGFAPGCVCEVDPELPDTGQWGCPHYGFRNGCGSPSRFRSRWATPLNVRITVTGGSCWVGSFEAG